MKYSPPSKNRTPHLALVAMMVALAGGSAAFWVLQVLALPRQSHDLRVTPDVPTPAVAASGQLGRALGVVEPTAAAPAVSNLTLTAVIGGPHRGVALIAADGQKATPFAPGDEVQPGLYLLRLGQRSAELGHAPQGPTSISLSISVPTLPGPPSD